MFRSGPRWHPVTAAGINDYIRELSGGDYTAKDFRTWHATVLAAVGLAVSGQAATESARKRAIARVVREVAAYLGNTPESPALLTSTPVSSGTTRTAAPSPRSSTTSAATATSATWPPEAAPKAPSRSSLPSRRSHAPVHEKDLDLSERGRDSTGPASSGTPGDLMPRSATPCVVGGHSSSIARRVRALRTAFASASLLKYTYTSWPARSHSPILIAHQRRSASG